MTTQAPRDAPGHPGASHAETLHAYLTGVAGMIAEMHPDRIARMTYPSYEALVLALGRPMTPRPRPRGIRKGPDRECYLNTFRLLATPGRRHDGWTYCEGYAIAAAPGFVGIPCLHAWAVDADNNVIDPTWSHPEMSAYYGIPFDWSDVRRFSFGWAPGILAGEYRIGNPLLETGRLFPDGWEATRDKYLRGARSRRR